MSRPKYRSSAAEVSLEELGIPFEVLSASETALLTQRWRETFSKRVKRETGNWRTGGYDWHTFSGDYTYALEGDQAKDAYRACSTQELFILPNSKDDYAVRISTAPVELDGESDIYIVPPDFAWTMVYTHEDGWLGPFFCRREWVDSPPPPEPSATPKRHRKRRGSRK